MYKSLDTKPLSQLIQELEQRYQEENDQSELFQKLYKHSPLDSGDSLFQNNNQPPQPITKVIKKERKTKTKKSDTIKSNTESTSGEEPKHDSTDKKSLQMIRNRISAQNSRDRKKAYLQQIEFDYERQAQQIQSLEESLVQLQQQLEDSQKSSTFYASQLQGQVCMSCGSKNIGYEEDVPLKVQKNRGLAQLGFSFLVILTIFGLMQMPNVENGLLFEKEQQQQQQQQQYQIRQLEPSDSEYNLYHIIKQQQIKGMTEIMEYNSEFNYKFMDTSYRAMINSDESIVNGMIKMNKEKNKQQQNNKALAPLDYHQDQVDSLYCPSVYKNKNIKNSVHVNYQDNQWIHLVIPRENMNIFYDDDNQITIKEFYGNSKPKGAYSELWCRVKSVNDLNI